MVGINSKKQYQQIYDNMQDARYICKYETAIREIQDRMEVIKVDLSQERGRDVVESICSRIKTPLSMIRKLHRKSYTISIEEAEEHLNDIAGVRVVCDYIDDIYAVRDALMEEKNLILMKEKDFVQFPKKSGYRSLHLIIKVPVILDDKEIMVKVEVQLRTVVMDFWARLDHQTRYKHGKKGKKGLSQDLNECSEIGERMDQMMLQTRQIMEKV